MWIVRAVRVTDLEPLLTLVQSATRGLTSLQLDRPRLLDRIEQSVFAFSRSATVPTGEPFVLVMVDSESGELVGTSMIYAKTGGYQPFYAYRLVTSEHHSAALQIHQRRTRLELLRVHDGPTEIGSLFLRGTHRGKGRGRWLSLARFAVIASRRHRFADQVIAEMRGTARPDGTVPFWESVTGRFIPTDFATADALSTVSKQFIDEMMPDHPIYLNLLPQHVRDEIGHVHPETVPAVRLLKSEHFAETDLIDVFDAGPVLSCNTSDIRAVRRAASGTVSRVVERQRPPDASVILCSDRGGFASVLTEVQHDEAGVVVARPDAEALGLEPGAPCITLAMRERPS